MQFRFVTMVLVSLYALHVHAFEPVNGNGSGSLFLDAPVEIRERITLAPTFEQAIDSLKALRQTNKQLRDYVDNPYMIDRLALYYKKKPSLVATYLGTPAAQQWFSQKKKTAAFQKQVRRIYNDLIAGKYTAINVPRALEWLGKQMPELNAIKDSLIVQAVKDRDSKKLAFFLDETFQRRKQFPELDMLIDDLAALQKKIRDARFELQGDFNAMADFNKSMEPQIQQTFTVLRMLIQNNAQISPEKASLLKRLIEADIFDKETKQLLLKTQTMLKKRK